MAQKRMVSDSICDTVTFCDMSASARALYLHLHCASDEDGCCNGAQVLRNAKLRANALDELIKNGYAIPLVNTPPKDRVIYLADWHNLNRYHHDLNTAPRYRTQLLETIPDIENALFKAKNGTVFAPSIGKLSRGKSSQGESSVGKSSQGESSQVEVSIGNVSTVNESIGKSSIDNVGSYSHDNNIPTLDLVINELMSTYYLTTTEAQEVGNSFIQYNNSKNWNGLRSKSWAMLLKQFVEHDKRYTPDRIAIRKAEAEKKAEEERKQKEQYDMFRHDRAYINSAQDLVDYIKGNFFFEYDYELGKCLFDMLYISKTLTVQDIEDLYDEKIFDFDDIDGYVELSDYGIKHTTNQRVKGIAERIKTDVWSGKYKPQTETEKPIIDTTDYDLEELPFGVPWQT